MAHVSLNFPSDARPLRPSDVGHGHIFESPHGQDSASSLPQWSTTPPSSSSSAFSRATATTRTQYQLAPSEVLKGIANRFVHSTSYIYLYATMALASFVTVVMSLLSECPGTAFYVVELVVNVVLVVEVGVRFVAFGRQFWHSTFNVLDLFLVFLCTLTLLVIFFSHDCSPYNRGSSSGSGRGRGGRQGKGEELLDSILLIFRNGMQLVRLLAVVRRSGRNALSRPSRIDLVVDPSVGVGLGGHAPAAGAGAGGARSAAAAASAPQNDFSLDIDLQDDAEATRSRMRDGGDWSAGRVGRAGRAKRGTEREGLMMHDGDDEDEEL